VVRITRESGPPRGDSVVYVTQQISSLSANVKLLKEKILYPTAYDDSNNKFNPTTYGTTAPCGPYLPQEVPPIFSTPAHLLHPCIPRMRNASLWTSG